MGRDAVVVGAGLGGLTAAVGLERCGWRVRVLERSPERRLSGAGIVLLANALRALDTIGVGDAVRAVGSRTYPGSLRDEKGRRLVEVDPQQVEARLGAPAFALQRRQLHAALESGLTSPVEHGLRAVDVEPGGVTRRAAVLLEGGGRVEADLVVAADGVRSALRAAVVPEAPEPRYVGSSTWLAVVGNPGVDHMTQTWGPGGEVGLMPMADGRLYWYATSVGPAGRVSADPAVNLEDARRAFAGWADPIPAVLAGVRAEDVLRFDLTALPRPLPALVAGRVALVGDAAHAMPPNVGQGGAQAIEDGVVLADAVTRAPTVHEGLVAYDAVRRPRTAAVLRAAWAAARVGEQLRNPVLVRARNAVLRALPASVMLGGVSRFAGWEPPVLPLVRG